MVGESDLRPVPRGGGERQEYAFVVGESDLRPVPRGGGERQERLKSMPRGGGERLKTCGGERCKLSNKKKYIERTRT